MRAKHSGESPLLLLDVIGILNDLKIPYTIVGALAASYHGVVRASLDADAMISLRSGRADVETLTARLRKAGLTTTHRTGDLKDPIGAILHAEDRFGNRADLLMDIRGMSEAAFSRAEDTELEGIAVRMIGIEDFIAMKIFAGGPKDLSDVVGVLTVSSRRINLPLLKRLVQPYGKGAVQQLQSLLQEHRPQ